MLLTMSTVEFHGLILREDALLTTEFFQSLKSPVTDPPQHSELS
jgi:hypothetical protein